MARTYLDLQDEVLDFGFDPATYRERVGRWLNDALGRLTKRIDVPLTATENTLALPSADPDATFYGAVVAASTAERIASIRLDDNPDRELREASIAEIDLLPAQLGEPTMFARTQASYLTPAGERGAILYFYPFPDRDYTVKVRADADVAQRGFMTSDDQVPGIPEEWTGLLVSYALSRAYANEDDFEASAFHTQEWEVGLNKLAEALHNDGGGPRQVEGMLAIWGADDGAGGPVIA